MKILYRIICTIIFLAVRSKQTLILENIALRQQIIILQRSVKRPKFNNNDRLFWIWLSSIWDNWKSVILIAKPETIVGWHRKGFKAYWKWKSRRAGRPTIDWELIKLIRKLQKENHLWSAQRIQGELTKLGYSVCENTVAKYMQKPKPTPDQRQNWKTFLKNHAKHIVAIDFLVVRTLCFKAIYVYIALSHDRRKILHVGVSSKPHSQWAIQQLRETFAFDETTRYVIRDNDKIYSDDCKHVIGSFGLEDKPTAKHSPWQNGYCERVVGTLRRECLDHMIILNEKHLRSVLNEFVEYYNNSRTHMSLNKDSPVGRPIKTEGKIFKKPILGGLHHVYNRAA